MDIIITGLLLVCAICLVFSRSIKIEVTHRYPDTGDILSDTPRQSYREIEEQPIGYNLDSVIQSVNETMGVDVHGLNDYDA